MPLTPDEQERVGKITASYTSPKSSQGDGFSIPFLLAIFNRIVALRDFAAAQLGVNQELRQRIRSLELRLEHHDTDIGEVYVALTPSSEDVLDNA